MKKLLLILLFACSAFASRDTIIGSGLWSNTAIWADGTAPGATDTVYKINNGTFNDTLNADYTICAFICDASTAGAHIRTGRVLTITCAGNAHVDDGTGVRNLGTGLVATGASATMHFGSTLSTVTASSCVLTLSGTTGMTFDDDKGITFNRPILSNNAKVTNSGAQMSNFNSSTTVLTTGNDCKITFNKQWSLNPTASQTVFSLGTNDTFNGSVGFYMQPTNNVVVTIPAFTYTGSGTINWQRSSGSGKFILSGKLDLGSASLAIAPYIVSDTFDLAGYNLTCAILTIGTTTATCKAYLKCGSGTLKISSLVALNAIYTTGFSILDLNDCKLISSGNVTFGANWTVNAGTSKISTTGTCSFTSAGKAVYDLTDSLGALTFADSATILNDFTILSDNSSATSWGGYGMYVGGDFMHSGTGTLNMGSVRMAGNSALFHIGSTVGTVTATSCVETFNGTGCTMDDDKGITAKSLTLGGGAGLTVGGAQQTVLANAGTAVTFVNGGSLTLNRGIQLNISASCRPYVLNGSPTITGGGGHDFLIRLTGSGIVDSLEAFTSIGTVGFTLTNNISVTNSKFLLIGNISIAGNFAFDNSRAGTNATLDLNGYSLTCAGLTWGAANATATASLFCRNSTITAASVTHYNTGATTDSLHSSKWNVSGSWTNGTNHTIVPGTSTVRATGTGTWTLTGKRFWDWRNVGSASSKVTLADSLQCAYFYDSTGKFQQNSKTIYVDSNYTNVSPDSAYMSANIVIGKDYYRGTPTLVTRTGGSIILDTTFGKQHDFTGSNNQIGPVIARNINFLDSCKIQKLTETDSAQITFKNGVGLKIDTLARTGGSSGKVIRWLSALAGSAARVWVAAYTATYRYFKDITSSQATITATDASNTDGTGNTNITFPVSDTIPTITSITPDHGTFGTQVTVAGTVFGASPSGYLNGGLVPHVSRDSISYVFNATDLGLFGIVPFVIKNNVYNTYDTINWSYDTIPSLTSALPLFAKLTPAAHGTITGIGMSVIDSVWYGDSLATIDSATYDALYVTLPNQTVRGAKDIRTHARYGYRDTLAGAITYKNLHVTSLTPPRGKIGDTVTARAIWGFGTTGLSVTVNDSASTVIAGYVDTLARFVAPDNANGNYSVRFINGAGDTTFNTWHYGTSGRSAVKLYYKIY